MEMWIIPTLSLNSYFYFDSKRYLEQVQKYSGSIEVHNSLIISLTALQLVLNVIAGIIMGKSQDMYIILIWISNAVLQTILLVLASSVQDEMLDYSESKFMKVIYATSFSIYFIK